jgi:hypothetical protein
LLYIYIFNEEYTCKVCYVPTNNRLAIIQNEQGCEETQAKQLMDEEISIRSTDETQVKQIMEEVVTGNIGENPYTSIPTLTFHILSLFWDRPIYVGICRKFSVYYVVFMWLIYLILLCFI